MKTLLVVLAGSIALLSSCLPLAWETDLAPDAGADGGPFFMFAGGGGGGGTGGSGGGFAGGTAAGGGMPMGGGPDAGFRPVDPQIIGEFLPQGGALFPRGPLRSSALSTVAGTQQLVAVVNDADFLYVLGRPNRRIGLPSGSRPSSVAVTADGLTAWVALRGLGKVAQVELASGATQLVAVGAEPTGVALTPTGRTLVVATFGEHTITLVDTQGLGSSTVDVGGNPRALTITDDGDPMDDDESAWVTLFYGRPVSEGSNVGRVGEVVEVSLASPGSVRNRVSLQPLQAGTGQCSPNQLNSIAQQGDSLYVTHVCVSPEGPAGSRDVVFPGLSVISIAAHAENRTAGGSMVFQNPTMPPSLLANPVDVSPTLTGNAPLVLFQGANRLMSSGMPFSVRVGTSFFYGMPGPLFEDPADGVPTAVLALASDNLYVLDASGRRVLNFVQLSPMASPREFRFETIPPADSAAYQQRLGRRHFATAEGPWSSTDSISCASCHPDGLTDGITWVFGAGPRQTPALTGTFERGSLRWHRAQNWTANADEISDVEGLVRSTMGGSGVIAVNGSPVSLDNGVIGPGGVARHDGLNASSRDLTLTTDAKDWLDIEAWIAALPRSPASARLDPVAVGRGRQLFSRGGCAACHGTAQWTVSRVPYVPSFQKNGSAVGGNGQPVMASGLRTQSVTPDVLWKPGVNTDVLKVAPEVVNINGITTTIGPERLTCVLRNVGTFDPTDPLEVKVNGQRAQGQRGFNPPSLLGLSTSAPYLHHGQAKTLTDLFSARYREHHQAFAPGFLSTLDGGVDLAQVNDLSVFLESIDDTTVPFAVPAGADLCNGY